MEARRAFARLPLMGVDNIANKRFQLVNGGCKLNCKQNGEKKLKTVKQASVHLIVYC